MMEPARADSWKIQPMPQQVAVLDYRAEFTPEEFERMARGLIPQMMEDKWFIFMDQNRLNLHRSWSGNCIYQVQLERQGRNYAVRRAVVNRQPDQYRQTDDAYDVKMLHFLIGNLLLGRNEPFPLPPDLPENAPEGLFQHHVAGTAYPEAGVDQVSVERNPWWKFWKKIRTLWVNIIRFISLWIL